MIERLAGQKKISNDMKNILCGELSRAKKILLKVHLIKKNKIWQHHMLDHLAGKKFNK